MTPLVDLGGHGTAPRWPAVELAVSRDEWDAVRAGPGGRPCSPALALALLTLDDAEATVAVDVEGPGGARDGHLFAVRGELAVRVRVPPAGGPPAAVLLTVFPVGLLGRQLTDAVPDDVPRADRAREERSYPFELFVAGLRAADGATVDGPVLAEVSRDVARAGAEADPGADPAAVAAAVAGQLRHLATRAIGRLRAVVRGPGAAGVVSWTRTTSGWFALAPARDPRPGGGRLLRVRPVTAADLGPDVARVLAGVLR